MLTLVTTIVVAAVVGRFCRARFAIVPGALLVVASVWAYGQTVETPLRLMIAAGLGAGIGLVAGALFAHTRPSSRAPVVTALVLAVVLVESATFWIGANGATVTWFGSLEYHGPRDRREVALTFDDGPNANTTLPLSHILDQFGAKAAFFEVGKAVAARPDITRALVRDGQLVANHSYHHDSWRWLDPRYLELERTQRVIHRVAGVCPTYFRPPHGQHTPPMAQVVHAHHMEMVTWDVSTSDWTTTDAAAVARHVLRKVRPGSIIDLHDGLDGRVNVDRTVLVRALPIILQGLRDRGLAVVRLDTMLGDAPYAGKC
jgi:peptidoglycan/xylan/chitin deacetylase (PgdA/CDA1 family)